MSIEPTTFGPGSPKREFADRDRGGWRDVHPMKKVVSTDPISALADCGRMRLAGPDADLNGDDESETALRRPLLLHCGNGNHGDV